MKRSFIFVVSILLAVFFLPTCAQEQAPPTEPVTNIEADIEALKAIPNEWEVVYHASDIEAVMQQYAPGAVRMPANEPIQEGKAAIRSAHEIDFSEYTSVGGNEIIDVQVSGDLGYIRGTYNGTSTPKAGGDTIEYDQKWVVVCRRQADGSWKTICEIWNENLPPQ